MAPSEVTTRVLRRLLAGPGRPAGDALLAGGGLALSGSYVSVKVFEKFGPGPLAPVLGSAALGGALLLLWLLLRRFADERAPGQGDSAPAGASGGLEFTPIQIITYLPPSPPPRCSRCKL